MKNIHLIPTDKPSRLHLAYDKFYYLSLEPFIQLDTKNYKSFNIYITSDEEIKEGDWFYNILSLKPEPFKACENGDGYVNCNKYSHYRIDCKKIILTTDQDLIKYGVQSIDDEFLEWFIKNPSCEFVEIKIKPMFPMYSTFIESIDNPPFYGNLKRKIIIPQEEPKQELPQLGTTEFVNMCESIFSGKPKQEKTNMNTHYVDFSNPNADKISSASTTSIKQETLEDAADIERIAMDKLKNKWGHLYTFGYPQRPFPTNYENDLNNIKVGLYEGAKWKAQRMYSKFDLDAEITKLNTPDRYDNVKHKYNYSESDIVNLFDKWFEQLKKK
jgi:hypothetical protein